MTLKDEVQVARQPAARVAPAATRPTPLPGFVTGAIGSLAGLAGASLLLVPILVLGIVRSISGGAADPSGAPAAAVSGGAATPPAAVVAAATPSGPSAAELSKLRMLPAGDPSMGEEHYAAYCVACHGADGKGKPNLGKDLVHSAFVKDQSDAQLIAFIKRGRDVNDPLNTSKMPMPPKAGNPAFTDGELNDVVAYMRQIQKKG